MTTRMTAEDTNFMSTIRRLVRGTAIMALISVPMMAQKQKASTESGKEQEARATVAVPASQMPKPSSPEDLMQNIRFRNLGPSVGGGRVTAVVGVPGQPRTYYVGGAAGGVFKSEDGGQTWKAIFEHQPVSSIGAIALAPSNPNLVWVGTGEANLRNDISTGRGVYFSPDAGASWRFMGLADSGQIANIVVNSNNPDVVLVGVTGHAWGPNPDRGVFRTTDGGKTWQKVLYVDDSTGVSDMAADPSNPLVIYAGLWQVQRHPWEMVSGGNKGGVYRSLDGGATWNKLSNGLPKPPVGRVGLAISPSNPRHIYAEVESKDGVLWESHDMGEHWSKVTDNMLINARPWYFCRMAVAPNNEDKVYFLSYDLLASSDGGRTVRNLGNGVHADHHAIWIDPQDPNRIIEGNDGGVYLTWNAGESWRFLDDLPIEQFYSIALDDRTPYNVCGGLQDNSGWCGPSETLNHGTIPNGEWWTAVYGDGQYVVPAHGSNLIYSDSQNGVAEALDRETGRSRRIRPYLPTVEEINQAELKYRFNWTTPIAVNPGAPREVYIGGNVVFKSNDAGVNWKVISPDLTRNDKAKQVLSGGPIAYDLSGAESYDTIISLAISQQDPKVIWAGSDDGIVHVTRDGGNKWSNVTPKGVPEWGRISQIEVSTFSPDTAYLAVDRHELDDNKPYVFKTHDFGQSWTAINKGLPDTDPAHVVREDPNQKGLLIVGTEAALFYSANDGEGWTQLKSGFATSPVYDLKLHKQSHDLIVATHGRGLWVLDDISPLEQASHGKLEGEFRLFHIASANHWDRFNRYGRSTVRAAAWAAPNRASGMFINYYLPEALELTPEQRLLKRSPVKISITGPNGERVRTLWGTSKAGINRVVWNLTYDPATPLRFSTTPVDQEVAAVAGGPLVAPGKYSVTVTVNGKSQTAIAQVDGDPRLSLDMDAFRAQARIALEVRDQISLLNQALNRAAGLHAQITSVEQLLASADPENANQRYIALLEHARELDKNITGWQEPLFNQAIQNDSKYYLHYLARLHDRLTRLASAIAADYDVAPNAAVQEELTSLRERVSTGVRQFNQIVSTKVSAFNQLATQAGASTLYAGEPIAISDNQ